MLEVTAHCNAHCDYCFVLDRTRKDASTQTLCTLVSHLAQADILFLTFTGGEPFLRPDILDIFRHAISENFFYLSFITNGTCITDKHLTFFADHASYFADVQFSIFSHKPEINDRYFGVKDALSLSLHAAQALKAVGINAAFALNVIEENMDSYLETKAFLKDLDFSAGIAYSKQIASPEHGKRLERLFSRKFFTRLLKNADKDFIDQYGKKLRDALRGCTPRRELCHGLKSNVYVNGAGEVYPCVAMNRHCLGNLLDSGNLSAILHSSDTYQRICSLSRTDIEPCASCEFIDFCDICPGSLYAYKGTFSAAYTPECNFTQALARYLEMHYNNAVC